MLLALDLGEENGKHLIASLIGNASGTIIFSFLGIAIIAAIVIYVYKKKNDNKGDKDDE